MMRSPHRIILLVEHNQLLRTLIHDALVSARWKVKEADVLSARVMLEQKTHFDLLVIDSDPSHSGLQLTYHIRALPHRKQTPIILLSIEDLTADAHKAGANAFLRKPDELSEMVDTIRRIFATHART